MKSKILALGLICFFISGFVFAQKEESEKITSRILNGSDTVYVIAGETIYHLRSCKKLNRFYTGMPLSLAKKRGYKPGPVCILGEKEAEIIEKKENKIDIDIFNLGRVPNSEEISIKEISLKNTIQDVLEKFRMIDSDFKRSSDDSTFYLTISPGILIRSHDKKIIQSILLGYDGKETFDGKTKELFNFREAKEFRSFIENNLGNPDFIFYDNEIENIEKIELYYLNGFIFNWMDLTGTIETSIGITSKSNVKKLAKESGAKTPKALKAKKIKGIPLSKTGFRNTLWGMSKSQTRKAESSKFVEENKLSGVMKGLEILVYEDKISNLDCRIVYYFAGNRLTKARYIIMQTYTQKNTHLRDFEMLKDRLRKKHGTEIRDDKIWSNEIYTVEPSGYGQAISRGHLMCIAEWSVPGTNIKLILSGANYKISHWVEYTGKAFKKFEKKVLEKAKKGIF